MLRCRNKREKVEKCGRVPVFPQINRLQVIDLQPIYL